MELGSNKNSILKPQKSLNQDELNKSADSIKEKKEPRRVSFAASSCVKPFLEDVDQNTIWDSTFEEQLNEDSINHPNFQNVDNKKYVEEEQDHGEIEAACGNQKMTNSPKRYANMSPRKLHNTTYEFQMLEKQFLQEENDVNSVPREDDLNKENIRFYSINSTTENHSFKSNITNLMDKTMEFTSVVGNVAIVQDETKNSNDLLNVTNKENTSMDLTDIGIENLNLPENLNYESQIKPSMEFTNLEITCPSVNEINSLIVVDQVNQTKMEASMEFTDILGPNIARSVSVPLLQDPHNATAMESSMEFTNVYGRNNIIIRPTLNEIETLNTLQDVSHEIKIDTSMEFTHILRQNHILSVNDTENLNNLRNETNTNTSMELVTNLEHNKIIQRTPLNEIIPLILEDPATEINLETSMEVRNIVKKNNIGMRPTVNETLKITTMVEKSSIESNDISNEPDIVTNMQLTNIPEKMILSDALSNKPKRINKSQILDNECNSEKMCINIGMDLSQSQKNETLQETCSSNVMNAETTKIVADIQNVLVDDESLPVLFSHSSNNPEHLLDYTRPNSILVDSFESSDVSKPMDDRESVLDRIRSQLVQSEPIDENIWKRWREEVAKFSDTVQKFIAKIKNEQETELNSNDSIISSCSFTDNSLNTTSDYNNTVEKLSNKIKNAESSCSEYWEFIKNDGDYYFFYTLYRGVIFKVHLDPETGVFRDIEIFNNLEEEAFAYIKYRAAFMEEILKKSNLIHVLGTKFDILGLLDYICINMEDGNKFDEELDKLEEEFGKSHFFRLNPDNTATIEIRNTKYIIWWIFTLKLSLQNIGQIDSVRSEYKLRESVNEEDINMILKNMLGTKSIRNFIFKLDEYVKTAGQQILIRRDLRYKKSKLF